MNDPDDIHKTYQEWNLLGRRIHSGEKACFFREGEPYFAPDQVYKPTPYKNFSCHLGSYGSWSDHGPKM